MIIRVYALYRGSKTIVTVLGMLLTAQIIVSIIVVAQGTRKSASNVRLAIIHLMHS